MNEIEPTSTHDGRDLRTALGRFPTGVAVISTAVADGRTTGPRTNHDPQQRYHTEEKTNAYQSA